MKKAQIDEKLNAIIKQRLFTFFIINKKKHLNLNSINNLQKLM